MTELATADSEGTGLVTTATKSGVGARESIETASTQRARPCGDLSRERRRPRFLEAWIREANFIGDHIMIGMLVWLCTVCSHRSEQFRRSLLVPRGAEGRTLQ